MNVIFMGTPDFALGTLDAIEAAGHQIVLVVSQPDRPKGRGNAMQYPPVKEWALERDIPVFQPERIRKPECIEELRKYPADIFVVAAFGQILPKEILEMPRLGCINVHASLLPKYRGAAPIQWSILNGDDVTGVTIMQMGVGLDDGDILTQVEVPIDAEDTGGSLFDKLAIAGGTLCAETMERLDRGEITPQPQDPKLATHVGMIHKELGKLDFSRPAKELECYIRGLNPWPSAYSKLGGKTLKIWKAKVLSEVSGTPGEIVEVTKDTMVIACGEGGLSLVEVQLEGKKRMPIADFLRGYHVEAREHME
ncbi:MAG: methionyl-tRNA formyltransferase [Lachnospiraceae bacterium]|nr:methionyl-tRNA formyltransferase [Lachnospiraceae bacterium]